jgi:hypothetical protein
MKSLAVAAATLRDPGQHHGLRYELVDDGIESFGSLVSGGKLTRQATIAIEVRNHDVDVLVGSMVESNLEDPNERATLEISVTIGARRLRRKSDDALYKKTLHDLPDSVIRQVSMNFRHNDYVVGAWKLSRTSEDWTYSEYDCQIDGILYEPFEIDGDGYDAYTPLNASTNMPVSEQTFEFTTLTDDSLFPSTVYSFAPSFFKPEPAPGRVIKAVECLDNELSLAYLGAIRDPARRFYLQPDVAKLKHSEPLRLLLNAEQLGITYEVPGSTVEQEVVSFEAGTKITRFETVKAPPIAGFLSEALDVWLCYLRTGRTNLSSRREFLSSKRGGMIFEQSLRSPYGSLFPLSDSGFGFSQLLPILAVCLAAPALGIQTVLVEQPELHLNPALQVRLAEFLLSCSSNVQVIVETHSEHIVNSLRALAAEGRFTLPSDHVKLLYISASGDNPTTHDLSLDNNGDIAGWPPEFFGEALGLSARILRAQSARLADS